VEVDTEKDVFEYTGNDKNDVEHCQETVEVLFEQSVGQIV